MMRDTCSTQTGARRGRPRRPRCALKCFVLGVALAAMSACGASSTATPALAEVVTIAGPADLMPLVSELADSFAKARVTLRLQTSVAPVSEALALLRRDSTIVAVTTIRPADADPSWGQVELARQPISMIVHPENTVRNLTLDELSNILAGRTIDWRQVGGPAMPIMVLGREPGAALRQRVDAILLGPGSKLTPNALLLPSDEAMVATVARRPEAIGYITGAGGVSSVSSVTVEGEHASALARGRAYPLWQSIILLSPAQPAAQMSAFLSFVKSRQGQRIVASWGYGQGGSAP